MTEMGGQYHRNIHLLMGIGKRRFYNNTSNSLLMFFSKEGNEYGYKQITNEQIGNNIISNNIFDITELNDNLFISTSFIEYENQEYSTGVFLLDTNINLFKNIQKPNTDWYPYIVKTDKKNYLVATGIIENKTDYDILLYKINDSLESVPFDTNLYVYDSLCPYPITSETIDLTDCMVWTEIAEAPLPGEYYSKLNRVSVRIFPNPAGNEITVNMQNTEYHQNMELQCFDMFGRHIHRQKIQSGRIEARINVYEWKSGIYLVIIKSNGKMLGKGKFVVK